MRHVIAGIGFITALYLAFWWSITLGRFEAGSFVFVLLWIYPYGAQATGALAVYYFLFRANVWATAFLAALPIAIALAWKLGWVGEKRMIVALVTGSVAVAGLCHHLILRSLRASPQSELRSN